MSTALAKRRASGLAALYADTPAGAALDALEAEMGGRDALTAAVLQVEPTSTAHEESLTYVMGLIADPRSRTTKLSVLCARGGVTVGELLAAYKSGTYAAMQLRLIHAAAKHIPAVVEDLYTRAQPHQITCARCHGTSSVPGVKPDDAPSPCPDCGATGTLTVLPELDRQKLALEVANLLPKKAPLIDARAVTIAPGAGGTVTFAQVIAATDRVWSARRSDAAAEVVEDVVEAEPIADPPPDGGE